MDDIKLPVIEDSAAIQLALAEIFEALLSTRLDSKRAGQLLYGLQIASANLPRGNRSPVESVESVTHSEDGDEIAPEMRVCAWDEDCKHCPHAATCPNRHDDEDDEEEEE